MNGMVITPEQYHSVTARTSNSSSPRWSILQVQIGYSQPLPLQEKAQQGGATLAWENRSKMFSVWLVPAKLEGWGQELCQVPDKASDGDVL